MVLQFALKFCHQMAEIWQTDYKEMKVFANLIANLQFALKICHQIAEILQTDYKKMKSLPIFKPIAGLADRSAS